MRRGLRDLENLKHRFRCLARIALLLADALSARFSLWRKRSVVIAYGPRQPSHRASGPVGAKHAGLNCGNEDSELSNFFPKSFRSTLESELACVVNANTWESDETTHRCDIEDPAVPSLSHVRQYRLCHGNGAEEVHFELPPDLDHRRFFDRSLYAITGIVHKRVDRGDVSLNLGDHGRNPVEIGHVEDYGVAPPGKPLIEFVFCLLIPHRADNVITSGQCFFR